MGKRAEWKRYPEGHWWSRKTISKQRTKMRRSA